VPGGGLTCAFTVPGRIEVLGKHTDYAGGRSLLAAADRGFVTVAVRRSDDRVRVLDASSTESTCFTLEPELELGTGWTNYPMTAARRIARNFPSARIGADVAFVSDLPVAAGMSSSSAFVVSTFLALATVNDLFGNERYRSAIASAEDLAGYLSTIENGQDFRSLAGDRGVGTEGGSEDHTAMLCARPGQLVQYAFAPVRFERTIPLPTTHRFVIAASGVRAEKTGSARARYNRAAALMRIAAEHWRSAAADDSATIGALLDRDPTAVVRLRDVLSQVREERCSAAELLERVDHFIVESREIIPAAGAALERNDLAAFGTLTDRSQAASEQLLGNQIPETMHLARSARTLGAVAASAFGAGFGGSVWALVHRAEADQFEHEWRQDYLARFPERAREAELFQTTAGVPTLRIL
jgi:galactokinase